MPPFPIILEKPSTEKINVSLFPTQNIFFSMLLLAKDEDTPGIHEWIGRTRTNMSKIEQENHKLALIGFFYALLPGERNITFPAYLNQLDKTDAIELRDKMLNAYACLGQPEDNTPNVNWEKVLASLDNYIQFLETRFSDENININIETKAYEYVTNPPAMKEFLVNHMNWVWTNHFKAEWTRVEPILQESVRAFKTTNLNDMSRIDAAKFVTGQDLNDAKWCQNIDVVERVVFIPNAHIGAYVHATAMNGTLQVVFGARQPEGTGARIPELDRTEIVSRLSALADENRLHILQLAAEKGSIRVQDVLEIINLSQPSVSRYLTQLTATGYLQERREGGAKLYSLNADRIEKTLQAASAFLLGTP